MRWQGLHGSVGEYCYQSEPYDPHRKLKDDELEDEDEGKQVKEAPFKPPSPPKKGGAGNAVSFNSMI